MPDKPAAGERGLFRDTFLVGERDRKLASELAQATQTVQDPRGGAVLLSMVNRLSVLEAEARAERIRRLGAETRRDVLVLDNEEAQEEITRLQKVIEGLGERVPLAVVEEVRLDYSTLTSASEMVVTEFRNIGNISVGVTPWTSPIVESLLSLMDTLRDLGDPDRTT